MCVCTGLLGQDTAQVQVLRLRFFVKQHEVTPHRIRTTFASTAILVRGGPHSPCRQSALCSVSDDLLLQSSCIAVLWLKTKL